MKTTSSYLGIFVVILFFGPTAKSAANKKTYYRCLKTQGSNCEGGGGEISGTCGPFYSETDPREKKSYFESHPGVWREAVCCSKLLGIANQGGPDYPRATLLQYDLFLSFDSTILLGVFGSDTFPVFEFSGLLGWDLSHLRFELIDSTKFRIAVYEVDSMPPYYIGSPNVDTITLQEVNDAYGAWLFGGGTSTILGVGDSRLSFPVYEFPDLNTKFTMSRKQLTYSMNDKSLAEYSPRLEVSDVNGKIIMQMVAIMPEGTIIIENAISPGIYLITIKAKWGQKSTRVFVD